MIKSFVVITELNHPAKIDFFDEAVLFLTKGFNRQLRIVYIMGN